MSVLASHHNIAIGTDSVLRAYDGQVLTRWSSQEPQQRGMWFEVDLNSSRLVSGLHLRSFRSPGEYPHGYVVKLSQDHQTWMIVARNDHNDRELDVDFRPQSVRYVRVELTQEAPDWWSVHEVTVKYSGGEMTAEASHNNLLTGRDNLTLAFDGATNSRWSTRTTQRPGMWFMLDLAEVRTVKGLRLDSGTAVEDYPRGYIISVSENGVHWREVARNAENHAPVNERFAPHRARYIRIEQTGTSRQYWWSINEVVVMG